MEEMDGGKVRKHIIIHIRNKISNFAIRTICLLSFLMLFIIMSSVNYADESAMYVVEKYCQLDFYGAKLSNKSFGKVRKLMAWEKDQQGAGWDGCDIISGYEIINTAVSGNKASVTVDYKVLGSLRGIEFEKKSYADKVDFEVVKVDNSWKIKRDFYPRISLNVAIAHLDKLLKRSLKSEARNNKRITKLQSAIDKLKKLEPVVPKNSIRGD